MKKLHLKLIACLLLISMVLVNSGFGAMIQTSDKQGDNAAGFTIVDDAGNEQIVDETWVEDYPYGIFALGKSELLIIENGEEQILKVYRLGGTAGKASAILHYQPAVTENEDKSYNYSSAISADDIIIEVEDPLPIAEYQAWGTETDPKETDKKIIKSQGTDGEGISCAILSLDLEQEAEAYQWYSLFNGEWTKVKNAEGPELPVGEEELADYDFRCVFTVNGATYCTNSYKGEAYAKPAEEDTPKAPTDIELNPEPTYSQLNLSEGNTPYDGFLFEVSFAQGEYEKEIHIRAKDDETAELDEYATFTITDCIGGQVLESLNTLMLRLEDNDEATEPSRIGFAVTNTEFDKSDGVARLTVVRSGDTTKALSVDWTIEDGTASAGIDFVGNSDTLYFYGSQTEQTIEVELINNKMEDYDRKQFTVSLSNLLGDDASVITDGLCAVSLYNSNKAEELNLASTLYDVDAVDISGSVEESSGAAVSSGIITGRQSTGKDSLDVLSDNDGVCTVEWDQNRGEEMESLLYQYGRITFNGGNWGQTTSYSMSVSSDGRGDKTSTTQNVTNISKLYKSLSASVYGGAKFASGWDRTWYGDKEFAYTYFSGNFGGTESRWDCNPVFSKSGLKIYLSARNPFYVSHSWNYGSSSAGSLKLGVATYESRGSDDNINASTTAYLTRRAFNNDFYLNIYTANDSDMAQAVTKYNSENYSNIVKSVMIGEGGAYYGKLYEGSTFKVELGNTHLKCTDAYIVDSNGTEVLTGSVSGNIITFSNVMLDPNGTYTVRLVLERQQKIKINVTTSTKVDSTGLPVGGAEAANTAAYNLLKSKNTAGGMITVGYTQKSGKLYSTADPVSTKISLGTLDSASGIVAPELVTDLQYVNFNLSEDDVILFNGKAYAGNETIWLAAKDLTPKDIIFYFYEKDFLSAERPMKATIDSTAIYYDGNGNGKIDGHFSKDTNVFMVTAPDMFINYLSDGDYEETSFQPVVDSNGVVHQYFMRPYYTANPVCFVVPMGHSDGERMQVMPGFITDVTDSSAYEALTAEQKQYRVIVSGKTLLEENGTEKYSSDDHYKYTAAATAYSYIDIPLGGDKNPSRQLTNIDLKTDVKDGIKSIDGTEYILKDGLAYYYSDSGPGGLGDAAYTWSPKYKGNLLYPFSSPSPIVIPHSLAGSNIPVTRDVETWYQTTEGTWTNVAPSGDDTGYAKNSLGKYITEVRANTAGAAALNAYLGAFGSNDTFALLINEQNQTTDSILDGLSSMDEKKSNAETITRGTVGAFPNSEYLKQNGSSQNKGNSSSEGQGEYEEFSADTDSELLSFSSEAIGMLGVEVDGYEVSFSIGIPVYSKDNGGGTGSSANTFDDTVETAGKIKDFIKAVKGKEKAKDALSKLAGEDLDANKLKSKSVEFTISVTLGITLKYSPLDNKYKFSEAALAASAGIELRLQYRFSPLPIIYVYAQFGAEGSIQTGLGQERDVVPGDSITEANKSIDLYEVPGKGQSRQYYFTSNMKAFNITFSGKLYMECYEFTDFNSNGKYDSNDILGDEPSGFNAGYLSSDGKEPTEVILQMQNQFQLSKPLVVVLTVMDDQNNNNNAKATISSIVLIKGVEKDLYWEGFQFSIEGSIELGLGVGVEIAKLEVYAKASLGIAFTLGTYDGDKNTAATFDEFSLSAGIGFRVVFLFFNYEQDIIEYHLNYENGSGWSHGWSAFGGAFGGDSALSTQGDEDDGKIHVYITPPSKLRARVYDNNVTKRKADVEDLAFNTNANFQVSGYGSSVNAFKLLDNVGTGYDYQIVTVGDDNFVVYTGTNDDLSAEAVDNTELKLSKLLQYDNKYGFGNPIKGNSSNEPKSIPVDGDGTGDLDFYTWADGDTIHVVWVSYANKTSTATRPEGTEYSYQGKKMSADNYAAIGKPAGGEYTTTTGSAIYISGGNSFILNENEITASNYNSISLSSVGFAAEPTECSYYTTEDKTGTVGLTYELVDTVTYWYPSSYSSLEKAKEAYQEAFTKYKNYTAYAAAKPAYDEWINYYKWYNYFYLSDVSNQVTAASRNTVVKHATFDTTATATDTKFTPYDTLTSSVGQTYNFLPHSEGDAVVYAQSVPYNEADLTARLTEYENYLDEVLKAEEGNDGSVTSEKYIAATKQYRLNYQQSMLSVYGGNSRLTIAAPNGTSYANGVMYVSKHQKDGNGVPTNQTNEILTNLELTKIVAEDGKTTYYLAYVTQQDKFEKEESGKYKDICTISRLYLRSFSIVNNDDVTIGAPAKKVVWGDPYLLRTVVNCEQDSAKDGIYDASLSQKVLYKDPYIANLNFLTGKLGKLLTGGEEEFETFDDDEVQEETFLFFEMNGNTYVIDQKSLASITGGDHKGTIHPFFTYQQRYGSALDKDSNENLSSGKSEVVVGADGDGNVAAVYTGSVPNTVNNAIYIAYWDPETVMWSDGVMLAMNYMDVYERSVADGWDADTTEKAYFDANSGGGMTQFTFSNLQVALGRKTSSSINTGGLSTQGEEDIIVEDAAASAYEKIINLLGIHPQTDDTTTQSTTYTPADIYAMTEKAELLGADTGSGTVNNAELLILTQGSLLNLVEYTTGSGSTVIAPERNGIRADGSVGTDNTVGTAAKPADVGIYAISYGKGEQQVGNVALNFGYYEFTVGSQLYAKLSLKNVGDAAIRGSKDQPVIVKLKLHDADGTSDVEMAEWEIPQNIGAGQMVSLATTDAPCKPLPANLGTGDYFYVTVEENGDYTKGMGGTPYSYNSSTDNNVNAQYRFNIEDKPELGVENLKTKITGVEQDGDSKVELSFDVTNRGKKTAEEVFVQFAYVSGYDDKGNEIYKPLDLRDSQLYVSQQKLINDSMTALGENDLSKGIIYLGTDDTFYTDDYYITAEKYNDILGNYYSTTEFSDWVRGTYNGVTYYYDQHYYVSAYAAYKAGQEAVEGWKHDSTSGNYYYNSAYKNYDAAKEAADAARKAEYIITEAQYKALSDTDKAIWKAASGFYIPVGYASYAAAEAAYEAAKADVTQHIDKSYLRNVRGTVDVAPGCFNGKLTGSLNLRITVFSKSSNASYNSETGLYSSEHADEYYAANNHVTSQLEHSTFIAAPARITLALGSKHILPVNIRTSTGKVPAITVTEVDDQKDELSTLYYAADNDTDGIAATAAGSLVVVGKDIGSGVIHITDTATNTTQAIAYTVVEAGEGINIYNDDTQFTFKNADADGSLYSEGKQNQSWRFQELSSWTEALAQPYLGNIAIGKKGASFTFETKASKVSMDMIGSAAVTSNKFPGTFTLTNDGITAPPTSKVIDFGNASNITHTITVTITSDTAYFDILRLAYGSVYVPSDDTQAPGLYWSRSFPTAGSVLEKNEKDEKIELTFTVYAVDESGLQSMSFNNLNIADTQIKKLSDSLWSYTFTVDKNTDFSVSASDTNGNATNRKVTVDWFAKTVDEKVEQYGQNPDLTASIYKVDKDNDEDDDEDDENAQGIYVEGANVTYTQEDFDAERIVKFRAKTDTGDYLTYYSYNNKNADFVKMTSKQIFNNGIYMVRADVDSYDTWSAQIFYVDCFEPMPEINVVPEELTSPNGWKLMWVASKDEKSTAKLNSVTLNGCDIIPGITTQEASYSGSVETSYGGEYLFEVTDTKGIKNIGKQILAVPVDLSKSNIFTSENAWGQPDNSGARYGSITIDFNNITGGSYANPTSIDGKAVPLDEYYGSYEYTVLAAEQCDGKLMPGDNSLTDEVDSWLTDLNWTAADHDKQYTADGLTVPAGGSGEYVVIIRDKQHPKQYSTMAVKRITLSDNAIDVVGLSARLASTSATSDGQVYVTANKGKTGAYEFAILPLDVDDTASTKVKVVYKAHTAEEFKQAGVTWKLTDWDSVEGNTTTFDSLATGAYQVAVRALYDGTESELASMEALKALNQKLDSAVNSLEQLKKNIDNYTSSMVHSINNANNAWSTASEETAQKKTDYDKLKERLTKGDTTVTNAMVDSAYNAWQDAITTEAGKEAAYKTAFVGATQEELDEILTLRTAWQNSDNESRETTRKSYDEKVLTWCSSYQQALYATDLAAAQQAIDDSQSEYDTKANELISLSNAEYTSDSTLWDGMIVSEVINVKTGTATSLRATPYVASSGVSNDGRIIIKADGGSAYDNGKAVHYQYAVLPLENEKAAVDYSGNMRAIANLNLDWQFADDPASDPGMFTKYELGSGWYQVFVRMVYDPDIKDSYDVNTNLSDSTGKITDLSMLRKNYDTAKKAAEEQSIAAQAAEAHAHYTKYLSGGKNADYQAYLTAIGNNADVLTALNAWKNSNAAGKAASYNAYQAKLKEYFNDTAQDTLKAATLAYMTKVDELNEQIDEAYSKTPGYYDTVSFTNAYVGVNSIIVPQVGSATYNGSEAIYKISSNGTLTLQDKVNIYEDNKKMRVRLIMDSMQVIVPAGALNEASDVSDVVNSFQKGSGNVVTYLTENGQMIINPISLVDNDKILYVYLGKGVYALKQSDSNFTDVTSHWAKDSILFVTNRGLFRGVTQERFAPNETMTRAMLVTVLYRMMGQPRVSEGSTFSDVPSGSWYTDAVNWAQENNIINGISGTQFAPDLRVNREQLVTILYRFLLSTGFGAPEAGNLSQYPDEGSVTDYAKDAFKWAVEAGIVNGTDKGLLTPQNDATRAQVAAVFERMIKYILK